MNYCNVRTYEATRPARQGDIKVISSRKYGDHFYNLATDSGEKSNLLKENKELFEHQKQEMKAWEAELIDPVFRPLGSAKKGNKKKARE